jgi:subtilisin family serine protease
MRRWARTVAVLTACAIAPGATFAAGAASAADEPAPRAARGRFAAAAAPHVPDRLLVRFKSGTTSSQRSAAAVENGARVERDFPGLQGLTRVRLRAGTSVAEAVDEFEARGDVLYAEPDYLVSAQATPNDSRFGELWGLHNTGQTVNGQSGTADADIDAPEAWNLTTGSTAVKVAVIDSGVATFHPDLTPNIWTNPGEVPGNGVDDDGNGFVDDVNGWDFVGDDNRPDDENGHGTHVAGTIGARGNNDSAGGGPTDVVGVNWQVSMMPVRVLNAAGSGSVSDVVAGILYAVQNGARIVNMSLGRLGAASQTERDVIAISAGVLFVVAAGNDGVNVDTAGSYPCVYPLANIVCVGATNANDQLTGFSNFGNGVDIAAPGANVLSTYPFQHLVVDGMEQTPITPRWVFGGTPNTWNRTTEVFASGTASITDSPGANYGANADNWARRGPYSASSHSSCRLSYSALVDTFPGDFLFVEGAAATTGPWTQIRSWNGNSAQAYIVDDDVAISTSHQYLRFRFDSDATQHSDGVYVDDLLVRCVPTTINATNYIFFNGTSMATPHVAGAAALALARFPSLTVAQLRNRLLNTADPKSLNIGGGRLNAFRAVANNPPLVTAGPDATVNTNTDPVVLQGSAGDPDGEPVTVRWVQTLGPAVTLSNPNALQPRFRAPSSPTTLRFAITASTATGPDVTDTVTITVRAPK